MKVENDLNQSSLKLMNIFLLLVKTFVKSLYDNACVLTEFNFYVLN